MPNFTWLHRSVLIRQLEGAALWLCVADSTDRRTCAGFLLCQRRRCSSALSTARPPPPSPPLHHLSLRQALWYLQFPHHRMRCPLLALRSAFLFPLCVLLRPRSWLWSSRSSPSQGRHSAIFRPAIQMCKAGRRLTSALLHRSAGSLVARGYLHENRGKNDAFYTGKGEILHYCNCQLLREHPTNPNTCVRHGTAFILDVRAAPC